jgi:membrane protease YdiL (CAAX protease family)
MKNRERRSTVNENRRLGRKLLIIIAQSIAADALVSAVTAGLIHLTGERWLLAPYYAISAAIYASLVIRCHYARKASLP